MVSGRTGMTLEECLAQGGEAWFLTGKNECSLQAMMVPGETSFHNALEAGFSVSQDDRLAAPLIMEPFTHDELGVLILKGSEDLLGYVKGSIGDAQASGRLAELAEEYLCRDMDRDSGTAREPAT